MDSLSRNISPITDNACTIETFLRHAIENKKFDNLILAANWNDLFTKQNGILNELMGLIALAEKYSVKVVVMPAPHQYKGGVNPISYWSRLYMLEKDLTEIEVLMTPSSANDELRQALASTEALFVERDDLYSPSGMFKLNGVDVPYTLDGGHISMLGSLQAYEHFKSQDKYNTFVNFLGLSNQKNSLTIFRELQMSWSNLFDHDLQYNPR